MSAHTSKLRKEIEVLDARIAIWRRSALAAFLAVAICVGITATVVAAGIAYNKELLRYREHCVHPEQVVQMANMASALVKVNDQCLELHRHTKQSLQDNLPLMFAEILGGDNDEEVPEMRDDQDPY